jgi:hypothetical protein
MNDEFFKERRVLPADYPAQANKRIRETLGFTDADFEALRRPYDDPRRTPSKRALLRRIAGACTKLGKAPYGG